MILYKYIPRAYFHNYIQNIQNIDQIYSIIVSIIVSRIYSSQYTISVSDVNIIYFRNYNKNN